MRKLHLKKNKKSNKPSPPVDFVVLTALEEERDAFLAKLRGNRKLDKESTDVHTYYHACVRTSRMDRSEYQVIVTTLLNMGPLNACAQAVSVVNRWKPRYILLVGIACGIRGEVNHGDVLFASQVADYTLGKQQDGRRKVRWEVFPCGASLLDSANNVPSKWENNIGINRPRAGKPQRHKGVIASGGDVISDDQIIATYSESWPKIVGIEMEAGGVAVGVHQTIDRPEFLMIKSVSDFGKDKHDPEVKPWRRYACHAAAAFAFNLIKSGPARSLSEVTASEQTANDEEDRKRAAERRWQYIQNHLLRGIEITFILKGYVGFDWFREVLMDTCLTFSRNDKSFKVGRLLADSASPNTVEHSRASDVPLCSFWEIYEPEPGYWFRKISPTKRDFTVVAGFDAIAPWTTLGIERVKNLEDLALLTEIGISIPARAYQVGVEEFILRFLGDTFSFSVQLTENTPLEALHEFARMQYTITTKDEPMPVGTSFSGVQLLDMFLRQLLPRPKSEKSKTGMGMMGLSGPDGKAISFYPTMPLGFNKRPESHEYSFTITTPAKFDSAARIKELENKLVSNPTDAELYFELASGYSYEGRLLDVIKCLENAIKAAPPSAKVHVLLGQTFRKLGRFDESLLHCEKALTLAPDDARMHNALGVCLAELDKHDAAMVHYETAAQIDPSQSSYQINHSMALVHLHRYSEAIAPAKRAVDLAPDDARCAILLGILFDSEGRRAEATHYFEIATQLAPDSAEAHEHLGTQLARANQHDKAIVCFQRAVEIEDSVRRCELLGASLSSLDRWSEAEEVFRRGVKLDPKHSGMLMNLGVAVATLGRAEEAIDFFKRSLEIDPNNVTAQRNLKQFRKIMEKLEKKGIART